MKTSIDKITASLAKPVPKISAPNKNKKKETKNCNSDEKVTHLDASYEKV